METLQDHVTLSAYELQKRLTDDMVALVKELLQFSLQTASGMAFILSQGFSHPSLSIANILLTDDKNCKLFDFCLKKDALCFLESIKKKSVYTSVYERSEFQGLVEYTTATDVWLTAYAIWQIFSQGALPIASGSDHDDVSDVFPKPELCPQILYIEMARCWSEPRSNRPGIKELSSKLTKHAIGPH
ncbi:protein-tyrosine kinase 6-like [Apostichopus japonicus]|uniref:protein-tyrosine kinase 6-like n=1 Tax=Stichopus japonicus TaxID=307972 RepID=UPI003AB7CFA1